MDRLRTKLNSKRTCILQSYSRCTSWSLHFLKNSLKYH